MHDMIRLRQVVVAARDLDRTVDRMCNELGLTVCFRDPGVGEFGLHNALMNVGDQFIEVVSPLADGTAAGRLLDRRHAEVTAYMVMFEVDDLDARMAALSAAGVRNVWSGDLPSIRGRHLHPADLGGAIVSIDQPDPLGSWHWAGPTWRAHADNALVSAIAGYRLAVDVPAEVEHRWAEFGLNHSVAFRDGSMSTIDLVATNRHATGHEITLDQVILHLV